MIKRSKTKKGIAVMTQRDDGMILCAQIALCAFAILSWQRELRKWDQQSHFVLRLWLNRAHPLDFVGKASFQALQSCTIVDVLTSSIATHKGNGFHMLLANRFWAWTENPCAWFSNKWLKHVKAIRANFGLDVQSLRLVTRIRTWLHEIAQAA